MRSPLLHAALQLALVLGISLALGAVRAHGATNAVVAGVGGLDNGTIAGGDGTGSGRFDLEPVQLALVKQARRVDGTVLPNGTNVLPGDELVFLLYLDNPTVAPALDVGLEDPLDETQFAYVPGTLEAATLPAGAGDAAIWAGAWAPLTDATGAPDDHASAQDTGGAVGVDRLTFGGVPGQTNVRLDVPSGALQAFRFRVRVN